MIKENGGESNLNTRNIGKIHKQRQRKTTHNITNVIKTSDQTIDSLNRHLNACIKIRIKCQKNLRIF